MTVLLYNTAHAGVFGSVFDGHRRGFLMEGGIGAGVTIFSQEHGFWRKTEGGIAFDLKIGYAPSNQLAICFMNRGMILTRGLSKEWREWNRIIPVIAPIFFTVVGGWKLFSNDIWSVSVTRFLKDTSPTIYFDGGIGVYLPFAYHYKRDEEFEPKPGLGLSASVGYEFSKGKVIAFDMIWGIPSNINVHDFSFLIQYKKLIY